MANFLSSATPFVERLLAALREGAALAGSDRRVGAITALALCIGLMLGVYLHSVISRRGRIAAMRKDLERITGLQKGILESVSSLLWTNQDLLTLKRETYQNLSRTLGALSLALSSILRRDAAGDKRQGELDSGRDLPARKAVEKRLDEFADLVIPARIAVSQASLELVLRFQSESDRLRQLTGGVASYGFFADLQGLADDTRKRLLETAGMDLLAAASDAEKRRTE